MWAPAGVRCGAVRLVLLGRGAEDVIPERRADAVAAVVILEVVSHVQLTQPSTQRGLGAMMVHVVVQHVVGQIASQEGGAEGKEGRSAQHQIEAVYEDRRQRDRSEERR